MKLENREDIDEVDWEVKKEVIRKSLFSQRENEVLGAWVTELREKADIVDNRKYYSNSYFPFHLGRRFSLKAFSPSCLSSLAIMDL